MHRVAMRWHAWLGLIFSTYLALIFLSGTLTIYGYEIESLLTPGIRGSATETPASPGQMFDAVRAHLPDATIVSVERAESHWLADRAAIREDGRKKFVWLSRDTAEVQAVTTHHGFWRVARDLHASLLTGQNIVRILSTAVTFFLIAQIITGVLAYRKFWNGYFRWPSRTLPARAWWGGIHRLAALWALPVILVTSVTAVAFFVDAIGVYPKAPPVAEMVKREAALPDGFDGAALDEVVAVAHGVFPDLHVTKVDIPARKFQPFKVSGLSSAILTDTEFNEVIIDPKTNDVLRMRQGADVATGWRIYLAAYPIHYGTFGGEVTRIIWLVAGALMSLVAVSGIVIYARKLGTTGGPVAVFGALPLFSRLFVAGLTVLILVAWVWRYSGWV